MKEIQYPELIGEMAKHGDNQKEIAKILGITNSSVCRKLSGKSKWNIDEIDILCKRYNKTYHYLFRKNERESLRNDIYNDTVNSYNF